MRGAYARDHAAPRPRPRPAGEVRRRARDETLLEADHQVETREPAPLAVRGEQLRRLLRLDAGAPTERRDELDEPEVADEPVVVATETLERDHARRPRPEPPLAADPAHERVGRGVVQPFEVDGAAQADESRRALGRQAVAAELCRREAGQRLARRDRLPARPR